MHIHSLEYKLCLFLLEKSDAGPPAVPFSFSLIKVLTYSLIK